MVAIKAHSSKFFKFAEQVEEELKLLEELVPEWISGKMSINGGYVFW